MLKGNRKNKRLIAIMFFVIVAMVVFCCKGDFQVLKTLAAKTTGYLENTFFKVDEEVKTVYIESDGYEDKIGGDYILEKTADWTGIDSAVIEFNLNSNVLTNGNKKDIIFVMDTSSSMAGEKYELLIEHTTELLRELLRDTENTATVITFDHDVEVLAKYSHDAEAIISKFDSIELGDSTNYYLALREVVQLLKEYKRRNGRDCVVLFLTDGFPTSNNPNQYVQFEIINKKYQFVTVYGIQYEMGVDIKQEIIDVSHRQYAIDINTLRNVLFDAAFDPYYYDGFELVDYIDNEYFYVESVDDIVASNGNVDLVDEDGRQKVIWSIGANQLKTGQVADLKINVKLKAEYVRTEGYYSTNIKEQVSASSNGSTFDTSSNVTPVLKGGYKTIYDMNTPSGCTLDNFEQVNFAFETVEVSQLTPSCDGYLFKGWATDENVSFLNDDYYIMPTHDVTFKATWTKLNIGKEMDGTVATKTTLYKIIEEQAVRDDIASSYVSSSSGINFKNNSSTTNGQGVYELITTKVNDYGYPIYYYRGNVTNNNVLFADFCWKIVRTTDTGGIKLAYNGPAENGTCPGTTTSIGRSAYNTLITSPAYEGYTYGVAYERKSFVPESYSYHYGNSVTYSNGKYTLVDTVKTSSPTTIASRYHYTCASSSTMTCTTVRYIYAIGGGGNIAYYIELTGGKTIAGEFDAMVTNSANTNSSTVKIMIEAWFKENLLNQLELLEDTVWCNDRTVYDYRGWLPDGNAMATASSNNSQSLQFQVYNRVQNTGIPTLKCNPNDSLTVNAGWLTYPIALLTADEYIYAGATKNENTNYYLWTDENNVVMSPYVYQEIPLSPRITNIGSYGEIGSWLLNYKYEIRPAISLKHDAVYLGGTGIADDPYVVLSK